MKGLVNLGSDVYLEDVNFIARDSGSFLGVVLGKTFWGAPHIKYLHVTFESRGMRD